MSHVMSLYLLHDQGKKTRIICKAHLAKFVNIYIFHFWKGVQTIAHLYLFILHILVNGGYNIMYC